MCRLRAKCCRAVEHHATDNKREVKGGTGMGQWRGDKMKWDGIVKLRKMKTDCTSLLRTGGWFFYFIFHNHDAICPGMGSFRGNVFPISNSRWWCMFSFLCIKTLHYRFFWVEWNWIDIVIILSLMFINGRATVLLSINVFVMKRTVTATTLSSWHQNFSVYLVTYFICGIAGVTEASL